MDDQTPTPNMFAVQDTPIPELGVGDLDIHGNFGSQTPMTGGTGGFTDKPQYTPMHGFTPTPGGLAASQIGQMGRNHNVKLPSECSRIVYVRNLPFKMTNEEFYDLFGKYGTIQQIRKGNTNDTKGTGFVVYDDAHDAKNAVDHLSGFNVAGRYLVALYYNPEKIKAQMERRKQREELEALKKMSAMK